MNEGPAHSMGEVDNPRGVDLHAHLFPTAFVEELLRIRDDLGSTPLLDRFIQGGFLLWPELGEPLDARIVLMDRAGIATQVLSYSAPHLYHPIPEARSRIARAWNDATGAVAAASGGRFTFCATLPLPYLDECLAEIERARTLLGAVGFGLPTHVEGRGLDDPGFRPLFDRLNETGEVVLLHPDGFCAPGVLTDHGMEWSIGAPFEDTIAALRLVHSGTLERCPDLRLVVPHLGGTLPFLVSRLDLHAGFPGGPSRVPSAELRKLYFDTAQSTPAMLTMAADAFGAERLVFGTDFPYANRTDLATAAGALETLGREVSEEIFEATRLFGSRRRRP